EARASDKPNRSQARPEKRVPRRSADEQLRSKCLSRSMRAPRSMCASALAGEPRVYFSLPYGKVEEKLRPLPLLHQPDEALEEITRIARAGRSFGVILHGELGLSFNRKPRVRTVEQRDMRFLGVLRQRIA